MKTNLSLLILAFFLVITSCNKDEEVIPSTPVITLLSESKIAINESTLTFDNILKPLFDFEFDFEEGFIYFTLNIDQTEIIGFSISDEAIDGKEVFASLMGDIYNGSNLNVEMQSDESFVITGELLHTGGQNENIELSFTFYPSSIGNGSSTIVVDGDIARINGTLGTITYNQILDLNANSKNVHTLLLEDISGSVNDEVNVETGRLIRKAGYTTQVKSTSNINSGGVDLFCSGLKRTIETGAIIGVHSWCCGSNGEQASDIPEGDSQHDNQIKYFTEMLGATDGRAFYFFTINAAEASGIHQMTDEEIEKYKLATE